MWVSKIGWEPIHIHMLNAAPHFLFFFNFFFSAQRKNEQQFFDTDRRLGRWCQCWQLGVRGTGPPLEAASRGGRCALGVEISIRFPIWLWFPSSDLKQDFFCLGSVYTTPASPFAERKLRNLLEKCFTWVEIGLYCLSHCIGHFSWVKFTVLL